MDGLLSKGKSLLGGNKSGTTTSQPAQGGAQGQGQQDYLDKGINAVQSKFGIDKDGKYNKYEEKATDLARGQYEKQSGSKVSDKFSN